MHRQGRLFPVLAALLVAVVYCAPAAQAESPLVNLVVSAPNRINPLASESNPLPPIERLAVDQQFMVRVGPPAATLSVSVVEPPAKAGPCKGTVLVLHGIFARSAAMLVPAHRLAHAGYRSVLVDLRGHGRSTGDYLGFGVQEARDLAQVIDELERRQLVSGALGAYGVSYGATTSIHLAGLDHRVRAVVAIEPFAQLREEATHFGRVMVPGIGLAIPDKSYQKALDEAGPRGGFDPDHADAAEAIRHTDAPVLLIHGTCDWIVPHHNSEVLHAAAPDHSELVSLPYRGHTALWLDPTADVAARGRAWFDRYLAAAEPNQERAETPRK